MLSVIFGAACLVLILSDICGKLHLARTRTQVLCNLFPLLGAATPFSAEPFVNLVTTHLSEEGVTPPTSDLGDTLFSFIPNWLAIIGVLVSLAAWLYFLIRTCTTVPVQKSGATPQAAAKQQLIILWMSLPFFLLMLIGCALLLVNLLSIWALMAFFLLMLALIMLPAILMCAVAFGYLTFWMALGIIPFLVALLLPYITGVVYGNRYLIACAPQLGWKKGLRIFLQVLMFLPWIRWIVTAVTMGKMKQRGDRKPELGNL